MRQWGCVLLLWMAGAAQADPHYVQVLHPWWGVPAHFDKRLEKLAGPVTVKVESFESSYERDMFLYLYVVDLPRARSLTVEVRCPADTGGGIRPAEVSLLAADPVRGNPDPEVTGDHQVHWRLDPKAGRQGMWFYSPNPPQPRHWRVVLADGATLTGEMSGPGCEPVDEEAEWKARERQR